MAPKTKSPKSKKSAQSFAQNNYRADFHPSNFDKDVQIMAAILRQTTQNTFFIAHSTNTPVKYITHAYQTAIYDKKEDTICWGENIVTDDAF